MQAVTVKDLNESLKQLKEIKANAEINVRIVDDIKRNIEELQKSTMHGLVVHNGKVLVQVDRKAREGDFVVFEKLGTRFTINGKFYEVVERFCKCKYEDENQVYRYVDEWGEGTYPKVYEVIGNLPQSDVVAVEKKCKHLTANQKRARVIQMAKEFVEGQNCNVEFIRKSNRVTCLLKELDTNKVRFVGRAECHVDDVFNEHIGRAVALVKALDIVKQLPPDILNAARPNSFVKGMKVVWVDDFGCANERIVERVENSKVFFTNKSNMPKDRLTIIDDTNADYSLQLQGGES